LLALLVQGAAPAHAENWAPRKPAAREVVTAIHRASERTGVDFAYLLAQAHLESSLSPNAKARSSSARGLFQFIDSTWIASVQRNGTRYGLGGTMREARGSRAALLELRSDPAVASLLAAADTLDNAKKLQPVLGRAPSPAELYLAHFLGSGGAVRFLSKWQRAPETDAAAIFPREARANRSMFYSKSGSARSLDDVLRAVEDKVNGGLQATAHLHRLVDTNATNRDSNIMHFKEVDRGTSNRVGQLPEGRTQLTPLRLGHRSSSEWNLRSSDLAPGGATGRVDQRNNQIIIQNEDDRLRFSSSPKDPAAETISEWPNPGTSPPEVWNDPCDHIEMCYIRSMSTSIITRVRDLVESGKMTRAGLARAAGLHANTLREAGEPDWNPTAETLQKLEMFLDSNDQRPVLVGIEEIIDEARNGRMYILVDDEDRENEGDLIIPAQMATPQAINFMAMYGRGLICLALTKDRVETLGLQPMSRNNKESMQTAFTISIEAKEGVTTGISAADRARTISVAIDAAKGADDLVTPGHVFPLMGRDGGTLVRAGHTEAAVDISRLAGLNPSGVICEIMNEDGTMARLDDLITFARKHDMKIGTIRDLIAYRMRNDHLVERLSERAFASDYGGQWRMITYRDRVAGSEAYVLQKGHVIPGEATLARVHPISVFDDVLGAPGPRKRTLQRAMQAIGEHGSGVIVILTGRVGTAAWQQGDELRNIGIGSQILVDLGVTEMVLLSNSRPDYVAIEGYGLKIKDFHPIPE